MRTNFVVPDPLKLDVVRGGIEGPCNRHETVFSAFRLELENITGPQLYKLETHEAPPGVLGRNIDDCSLLAVWFDE